MGTDDSTLIRCIVSRAEVITSLSSDPKSHASTPCTDLNHANLIGSTSFSISMFQLEVPLLSPHPSTILNYSGACCPLPLWLAMILQQLRGMHLVVNALATHTPLLEGRMDYELVKLVNDSRLLLTLHRCQ
jgi:hypothetical protein